MKKIFVFLGVLITILCMFNAVWAEGTEFAQPDTVMKISMDGAVKRAKEIGSGNGIEITLPALNDSKFNLYAVGLAVFEKTQDSSTWSIYKDANGVESKRKLINSPSSLRIQVHFGNMTDYKIGAKYKMGYRYYVQSVEDTSKIIIAGQDNKDGWRLAGEANPVNATIEGFTFYPNNSPCGILSDYIINVIKDGIRLISV